jgi:uncharacterized protein (TIGR02246 family)
MAAPIDLQRDAQIDALYTRYAYAIDTGDAAGWSDCFVADGEFRSSAGQVVRGRPALRAYVDACHETWGADGLTVRHWVANRLLGDPVPVDGEQVVPARCYSLVIASSAAAPPRLLVSATFEDELVERGGVWRFRSRRSLAGG